MAGLMHSPVGIFTLDTEASPEAIAGRYSWRRAIEPSSATGKQLTGAGDACSRTPEAVGRAVPFAFLVQSLMIIWYAVSCDPAAGIERRRQRCPWYQSKTTPAPADMHAALQGQLLAARISGISPGQDQPPQTSTGAPACDATAA